MAFLVLNDGRHTMDAVLFPDKFKRYETQLNEREMYVVWGKFEKKTTIAAHFKSNGFS